MKIAILTEIIDFHSGSRAPLEIARQLSLLGNNITIYSYSHMSQKSTLNNLKKTNIKFRLIKKNNLPIIGKYISSVDLYKYLKKDNPDVAVFCGTFPFFIATKISKVPIVRIYFGTQFNAYLETKLPTEQISAKDKIVNSIANLYIFVVEYLTSYFSKKTVAISLYAKKEYEALYKKKVDSVIYLGATILKKPKNILPKNSNNINIISVSRITPYKGFHKIIDAINNIKTTKKITFILCGSQPKENYLNYLKKIGSDKLKVFIDPTDEKLAEFYNNADIYASADKYLYFGLPITEAALYSKPAISLNYAAAGEIIEHKETGLVANNQKEFTRHLKWMIENPKETKRLGIAARIRAEKIFSWKKVGKEYNNFLLKTLNGK